MQYQQWLQQAEQTLLATNWLAEEHSLAELKQLARRDGQILLSFVTGRSRSYLLAFPEQILTFAEQQQLAYLLKRRAEGQPIAYLLGEKEFWSLPLAVSPLTLIPRPDTELLVEQALQGLAKKPCHILDLGTGTGAIALAVAHERPDCQVIAIDYQQEIVQLATTNAKKLALPNVQIIQSNWFSALTIEKFDLIVSNPPYIDENDHHLQQGDVRFEPRSALVAQQKGLADLQLIIAQAGQFLHDKGYLMVEHGWQQAIDVVNLFKQHGFFNVDTVVDYAGQPRVTRGQWLLSMNMEKVNNDK